MLLALLLSTAARLKFRALFKLELTVVEFITMSASRQHHLCSGCFATGTLGCFRHVLSSRRTQQHVNAD